MIDVAAVAADTVIAMVIDVVAMAAVVVMTIAAALAMTIMIDAAMEADVTVTTAIALETSIAMRVADVMTDMEVVVIEAATVAAIDVVAATMIVVMTVPRSLLLLETNHVSLTQEADETMAAAMIATQVGRLVSPLDAQFNGGAVDSSFGISANNLEVKNAMRVLSTSLIVSSETRAYDSFPPHTISPSKIRFRFPTCIPRLFTRLDWELEAG